MSSKGKRSSILKKRPSMGAGSLESSPTEATATVTTRATKRIGFKPKKSVKEFFASDETATIWCNSYELSAEGTPLHLTISDTTLKVPTDKDKENVEDSRRNSINSSAWNLSVSVSEEEKRRMRSDLSMNSSVLNVTDRLTLEPTTMVAPPPRPVLAQKQSELAADSSAMDVSPAKGNHRTNSPRKTIYYHPKQNMFITIDDVVTNDHKPRNQTPEHQPSPNDTDINFFGPPRPSNPNSSAAPPAKVLFQTSSTSSNITNPWRNKSVHTSDISATGPPRYTFYNSQFEVSEAWNSHPAAALKLRMLQQGLEPPPDFDDPRLSGGGGGGSSSDVDTTLAITQTVAKMLRPSNEGSNAVSLESSRVSDRGSVGASGAVEEEPEAMDVTSGKETFHVDVPMQMDDDDDHHQHVPQPPSLEASLSDVLLPPNALSRARPSFIPSTSTAIPMDESYCPSPEPARQEATEKRVTMLKPVPMELPTTTTRQTIVNAEQIKVDVPSTKPYPLRHTVFGARMELAADEKKKPAEAASPLPQMETIKVDLQDLVFARNSIGLDLVPVVAATPADRPKIHRIAPRPLGFDFGGGLAKPRGTVYSGEVEVEQTRVEQVREPPRKTIVQSLDVSMVSPAEESVGVKVRGTVFVSEDVNESVVVKESDNRVNHLRPTMLFNEKLEVSKLEPRTGSLEDLRKYGQSRKTILSGGEEDVIVLDSPDVSLRASGKVNQRGTLHFNGDMDRTRRTPSPSLVEQLVVPNARQTTVGPVSIDHTMADSSISPLTVPTRFTVYDDRMDETRIKELISPEVAVPINSRQTCYQAEMDETVPVCREMVVTNLPRKSVVQEVNMDETRGVGEARQTGLEANRTLQKTRQTSVGVQDMNETMAVGTNVRPESTMKSRQTNFAVQDMNETGRTSPFARPSVLQHGDVTTKEKVRQTNLGIQDMNETRRQTTLEGTNRSHLESETSKMFQKSRQTSFAVQNMNETGRISPDVAQQVNRETLQKSRQTNFALQDMNETGGVQQDDKSTKHLEKSRQTSFAVQDINETRRQTMMDETAFSGTSNRTQPLQKSRQTSFAVQDMNETGRVSPNVVQQVVITTRETLQKSRQTNFVHQGMNETGVTQQVDQSSKNLEKSRQTSFAVQDMNETRRQTAIDGTAFSRTSNRTQLETETSEVFQKGRQTSFDGQNMSETGRISPSVVQEAGVTARETFQKSRQTNFTLQDMNETGVVQQFDKSSKNLEKSRQTSFAVQDINETRRQTAMDDTAFSGTSNRTQPLQKGRQTSFAVQNMNETGRVSPNVVKQVDITTRETLQKSRQTNFALQDMNETGVIQQVDTSSKNLEKSRKTSFAVQEMNRTVSRQPIQHDGIDKSLSLEQASRMFQKTQQTSFAGQDMNETNAESQRSALGETAKIFNKSRPTSFAVQDMNETGPVSPAESLRQSEVHPLEQTNAAQKSRHTSFAVDKMDETMAAHGRSSVTVEHLQKSRQTVFQEAEMEQTRRDFGTHLQANDQHARMSTLEHSRAARVVQPTRQTSFAVQDMNETNLQRPEEIATQSWRLSKSAFKQADMDQTRCQSPIHIEETFLQSPQRDTTVNHSTVVERPPRQTIYHDAPMEDDETVPIGHVVNKPNFSAIHSPHFNLEQSIKRHSRQPRQTIYGQESMDETIVGNVRTSDGGRQPTVEIEQLMPPPAVGLKASRKTVYCEDEMEQTTAGFRLRRAPVVERRTESPVQERVPSPEAVPVTQPKPNRQTILAPLDMEQSMMQSMEVSVIRTTPHKTQQQQPRRTIMPSDSITEESFQQRSIKLEESLSPSDASSEKSDFSFTMPALPEDRVLRSSAVIPAYRMAPVARFGHAKSLVAPSEEANASVSDFLVPSTAGRLFSGPVRVPMDELSEISGFGETSRLYRALPPGSMVQGDVSSFALKEVTEPSILQPVPAVPTPVIQETPRKASLIPVARRSRGSIFNRQSVDMDMSGVTVMDGETPGGEEVVVKHEESCVAVEPEVVNLNASEEDEFYDAETHPVLEVAPPDIEQSTMMQLDVNQTAAGLKTLKFIDVDELEQTAFPSSQQQQKRQLSQISRSVLLEQESDPLNVSISEDYPLKKRKTAAPTSPAKAPLPTVEDKPRKSLRRVTFQPELDLETVTIKKECVTIVEADETNFGEESRFDPSIFIIEESDMLANESKISLVASPTAQDSSSSRTTTTTKYDNSIYREYGNLTLNVDSNNSSCIVISDDSLTASTTNTTTNARMTMVDLPKRIRKSRESLVLNSTVASEVMYELNHEVSTAKQRCCSFQGSCNCKRPRRTMAVVRMETVGAVRAEWEQSFGRILESVADVVGTVHDLPLDERICEILGRPMKALPLPLCLERQQVQLPEVPSVWFLSENFLRCTKTDAPTSETFTPCDLPATPSPTALVRNRLETQGFRWLLDSSCESERRLYLRHRTLRTLRLALHLQKSPADCPDEHVRIERLELAECWEQAVPSTRLLAAHAEFMEIGPKNVRDVLSSMCTSTAHLMCLVVHLDTLVAQVLSKVDALWRIVKNNGAVLEEVGTDRRLRISKFFEYRHESGIQWNRLEVQFDAIDRIERGSVTFHRPEQDCCASLFPTEQQCGKSGLQGLVFLECLLWNVEKFAIEC